MKNPETWSEDLDKAMQTAIDDGELGLDIYEWWEATGEAMSELGGDHPLVARTLGKMHGEMWDYVRVFELNRDA